MTNDELKKIKQRGPVYARILEKYVLLLAKEAEKKQYLPTHKRLWSPKAFFVCPCCKEKVQLNTDEGTIMRICKECNAYMQEK